MLLIHYPFGPVLPPPWQTDWQVAHALDLPNLPRRLVARAPAGTSIPDGAAPYRPPEVTDEHRRLARADLVRIASAPDSLRAGLARIGLDERERLDEYILACLGVVHPLALVAPFSIATMSEAVRTHLRASNAWTSPHSSVVVRCALRGYNVWTGIGVMMARAGRADDYASAEALGIAAVRDRRRETLRWVREEVLAGWSPETPYYTSTIARAEAELPITVRRGPTTNQDLGIPSSSYDLPIVAVFRGDSIERFPERITWSDDASRARARERGRPPSAAEALGVSVRTLERLRAEFDAESSQKG